AAWSAVAAAETALQEAKKYGRQHLALAYLNREEVTTPTPADCQTELDLRRDQYRHATEVWQALGEEISRTEFDLSQHRHRRDSPSSGPVDRASQPAPVYASCRFYNGRRRLEPRITHARPRQ